jgi:hypothetical protein
MLDQCEGSAAPASIPISARTNAAEVFASIIGVDRVTMKDCTVVGKYRRYDERTRQRLRDWCGRIARPLIESTHARENFLICAAPGSGKTYLIEQAAEELHAAAEFVRINFASATRDGVKAAVAAIRARSRPTICMLDEIDHQTAKEWGYEEVFEILDDNKHDPPIVFVLIGSTMGGLNVMVKDIESCERKGRDLMDRTPAASRFEIPALTLQDKIVVIGSQVREGLGASLETVVEVEKLALYYILSNADLQSPRQLSEAVGSAIRRLPAGDVRLTYGDLFDRRDSQKHSFWASHRNEAEKLQDTFVIVGN